MQDDALRKRRGSGWKVSEWLLGVIGGVAVFFGLFAQFGPEDEYIGLGGDLSWRAGDISSAWIYGLTLGGIVLLAGMAYMIIAGRSRTAVESTPRVDLAWHAGVFAVVNALVWAQDFAVGGGLDFALYMTIPWLAGLAIHALLVYFGTRDALPTAPEDVDDKELQHH